MQDLNQLFYSILLDSEIRSPHWKIVFKKCWAKFSTYRVVLRTISAIMLIYERQNGVSYEAEILTIN